MSQIIVEQQFHDDKHFPNAIFANRDAKLGKFLPAAAAAKVRLGCKIFAVAKIFINSVLDQFTTP